jgi:hypothetical protein
VQSQTWDQEAKAHLKLHHWRIDHFAIRQEFKYLIGAKNVAIVEVRLCCSYNPGIFSAVPGSNRFSCGGPGPDRRTIANTGYWKWGSWLEMREACGMGDGAVAFTSIQHYVLYTGLPYFTVTLKTFWLSASAAPVTRLLTHREWKNRMMNYERGRPDDILGWLN